MLYSVLTWQASSYIVILLSAQCSGYFAVFKNSNKLCLSIPHRIWDVDIFFYNFKFSVYKHFFINDLFNRNVVHYFIRFLDWVSMPSCRQTSLRAVKLHTVNVSDNKAMKKSLIKNKMFAHCFYSSESYKICGNIVTTQSTIFAPFTFSQ